mgnify:FL=1
MSKKLVDDETLQKILATLLGETEDLEDLIPEYQIKGRGDKFFFDPEKRQMVRVKGGTKCYLLNDNYKNKKLVYAISNYVIMVDEDDLHYIGYN